MFRSTADDLSSRTAIALPLSCVPLFVLILWAGPLGSQTAPPAAPTFQDRIAETARALANRPRLKRLSPEQRQAAVEFVVGNMLFTTMHELGHGAVRELELPVLGREEDAADAFAILNALKTGSEFSHRVLVEAAKGWFLSDRRDKKNGEMLAYYDEHGMDLQRAYQIVCFLVGSDPKKFADLAAETKLPNERQESCQADYREASWSWETALKPHFRPADQPKQNVEVIYGEGKGKLEVFARTFRNVRFLETVAERVTDRIAWPRPFVMEMQSCGGSGASWKARRLTLCYELAEELAQLYYEFGGGRTLANSKLKR